MSNKPIIVFEGVEGSGKTTHIKNVARYLKKNKKKFVKIREPGGSNNAERIRKILLNKKSNFNKYTDLFLLMAARSENIEKIILKNYKKKIILIERFIDSTVAYQHYGMGINKKFIYFINKYLLKNIKPDFVFLHKVNQYNMRKRLNLRKNLNRYDNFNKSFYNKVQKGFVKQVKKNRNFLIIDSNNQINKNKEIIINKVRKLIK